MLTSIEGIAANDRPLKRALFHLAKSLTDVMTTSAEQTVQTAFKPPSAGSVF
jgi:hypothetical protein